MNTSDPNQTTPSRDLSGLKVLIIDDSKSILRIAEALLAEFNCWVMTASDGFEALPVIASFKPDVIFVDIMMPRLDGYQTCALIKANRQYKDIPVIMLSSKDGLFDLAKGRLAGSDRYLTKPFTRDDMLAALESDVIKQHREVNNKGAQTVAMTEDD
ncbi:MAG: pilus assembly protein PilG [Proteobacteria bacterium]|nr:MAG: pilus assembly protein PilG [Pseudomonadota bacterium]